MKKRILLMLLALVAIVTVFALTSCEHECDYAIELTEASTPATCTKSGVKVMKCSECENTKNEIIPALGHDYVSNVVAPTCDEGGYTTQSCSRCGDTNGDKQTDKTQPTNQHDYKVVRSEPVSCTVDGYTLEKCSACDRERRTNVVTAPGHNFVEKRIYVNDIAPTCTVGAEGVTTKRCSVCDEKDQTFKDISETYPALGHDIAYTDAYRSNTVAATCTTAQHDTWKCARCEYTEESDVGTALGHDYKVDLGVYLPATCCTLEIRTFQCSRKGEAGCVGNVEMNIPQENTFAAHTMGASATCVDAQVCTVCLDNGRTELGTHCDQDDPNCTKCSKLLKVHVFADPTGQHNYKDYTNNTFKEEQRVGDPIAPTCMRQGYSIYSCTVCGGNEFKDNYTEINPDNHNVDFDTVIGEPVLETCIKHEYTVHKCTNTAEDGTTTCAYTEEYVYGQTFADHMFADGDPTGVITCTYCQQSFYDTTYVESVYNEYIEVEAGTGQYKKVETYEEAENGEYILDTETQQYRPITDGETGTHKLVVRFEEATGEGADYILKVWDGETGTEFDDDTSLNVTITVSKSDTEPMSLTGNEEKTQVDGTNADTTKISIIRIVTDDEDATFVITVNGEKIEHTGNGYIDICEYGEITSLTVKSTSLEGTATVYFYGEEAVPAE